jgi:hypothetical protein
MPLLAACAAPGESSKEPGARIALSVAPLTLPGVTNACWGVRVENEANELVWERASLCADQFGNGEGDISYVGPCDASLGNAMHTITLTLVDLYTDTPPVPMLTTDYQNPCPVGSTDCQMTVECKENADVPVTFNIAVMRRARQGFFDVAVNFDDVFCSGKVDCLPNPFLHNPATGERDDTVIAAFGCTAGPGQHTVVLMNELQVVCGPPGNQVLVATIDPSAGPGNHYFPPATPSPSPFIFQAATWSGLENFTNNNTPLNKCYWNVGVGIEVPDVNFANCSLVGSATVVTGPVSSGNTPANTMWPVIQINVPITNAQGQMTCGANPLNGQDSGVTTTYSGFAGASFCHALDCVADGGPTFENFCDFSETVSCTDVTSIDDEAVSVTQEGQALTLTVGGLTASYGLPAGHTLEGCCASECCAGGN